MILPLAVPKCVTVRLVSHGHGSARAAAARRARARRRRRRGGMTVARVTVTESCPAQPIRGKSARVRRPGATLGRWPWPGGGGPGPGPRPSGPSAVPAGDHKKSALRSNFEHQNAVSLN